MGEESCSVSILIASAKNGPSSVSCPRESPFITILLFVAPRQSTDDDESDRSAKMQSSPSISDLTLKKESESDTVDEPRSSDLRVEVDVVSSADSTSGV